MSSKATTDGQNSGKGGRSGSIHWGAMGSGLIVAGIIHPAQQSLLFALGLAGLVVHWLDRPTTAPKEKKAT